MNLVWVDLAIAALFVISILVGIFRGFVKEVLSVVAWLAAAWVTMTYGEAASGYLSQYISNPDIAKAASYVAVFLAALVVFSIVGYLISKVFTATGMTGIDRSLGSVFGAIRAALVVAVLILVGRYMAFEEHSWWSDSQFMGYFEQLAEWIRSYLPEKVATELGPKVI